MHIIYAWVYVLFWFTLVFLTGRFLDLSYAVPLLINLSFLYVWIRHILTSGQDDDV